MIVSDFERRMRPFIVLQAAVAALGGFAGVFVYAGHGPAAVARYAALMYGCAGLSLVGAFALGMRRRLRATRLVQAGFALAALLLPWADGRPDLLALAIGGFLGLSWGARHWLELQALGNDERDGYATHVIALAIGVTLVCTVAISGVLALSHDTHRPVYLLFALLAALGALFAGRHLPEAPPVRLERPLAVLRQAAYRDSLPLFLLESGLIGITMVLTASGAMQSLQSASDYGWAASAATLAGALALRAMRSRRHSGNRVGWMRAACFGIVAAAALLGASALLPALFIAYLLLQAVVSPFWAASEHVLNQRALDIHGAVGDRIAAREGTLALFRTGTLAIFWWATGALDDPQRLVLGAAIIGLAAVIEFQLGRRWLAGHAQAPGHTHPA